MSPRLYTLAALSLVLCFAWPARADNTQLAAQPRPSEAPAASADEQDRTLGLVVPADWQAGAAQPAHAPTSGPHTAPVQPSPPCAPASCRPPVQRADQRLEVTFGSAQLFNHQSILTAGHRVEEQIIPVTSALFMLEWLMHDRLSVLTLFNLPLTTQKTVVDGVSQEEFVAPSVALGLRVSALRFDVFAGSRLELQLAALGGVTVGSSSGDQFFPLAAGRFHFASSGGFALYLGGAFAFQRDTVAILYGIGHRF